MRKRQPFAGVVLVVVASLLGLGCGQPAPRPVAVAQEPFPVPVIELRGSGTEIGSAHGQVLGTEIQSLFTNYLGQYFSNPRDKAMAMLAAAGFQPHVLPEHREEIAALASSSGIAPGEAMLAQCFLDLSAMYACSSISVPASASPDGVGRFARNLDFLSFDIADKHSVVLVYHPASKYQFAEVGWPGIIGVLSGMNEHGLTLANMEVDRPRRLPSAMPYTLLYRTVLEQCRTVQEAIDLLQRTPRQSANNLMLMDGKGDRAVVELRPSGIHVRRAPADAPLISTNHQRGDDLMTEGRCRRYDTLSRSASKQFGRIDCVFLQKMLGEVAQGRSTMQSMVFEPQNRVIWLAVGANAASKKFYRLDLKRHFDARGVALVGASQN